MRRLVVIGIGVLELSTWQSRTLADVSPAVVPEDLYPGKSRPTGAVLRAGELVAECISPNEGSVAGHLDVREASGQLTLDSPAEIMQGVRTVFSEDEFDRPYAERPGCPRTVGDASRVSRAGVDRVVVAEEDFVAKGIFDFGKKPARNVRSRTHLGVRVEAVAPDRPVRIDDLPGLTGGQVFDPLKCLDEGVIGIRRALSRQELSIELEMFAVRVRIIGYAEAKTAMDLA